jgi:putative (di)nucleoside polyphosphate hydrolase
VSDPRPYRANVGVALFDSRGRVLIARRTRNAGPEIILPGREWQMPQGGVDPSEDAYEAAKRELFEETGVTSTAYLGQTAEWLTYDFPPYDGPSHFLAAFRGQQQKWFALRFTGAEDEINVTVSRDGEVPEFDQWRWERLDRLAGLVVPFKRAVYERVIAEFAPFT